MKILGGALIGLGVLHMVAGENDPLAPFWNALTGSLELVFIGAGIILLVAPGVVHK